MSGNAEAETDPSNPGRAAGLSNIARNVLAGLAIAFVTLATVEAAIAGLVTSVVALLVCLMLLAMLTSPGKAWRSGHKVKVPGMLIAPLAVVTLLTGMVLGAPASDVSQKSAIVLSDEDRLSQARAALRNGNFDAAREVLRPMSNADNERVKALEDAADAVQSAHGETSAAAKTLVAKYHADAKSPRRWLLAATELSPELAAAAGQEELQRQAARKADAHFAQQAAADTLWRDMQGAIRGCDKGYVETNKMLGYLQQGRTSLYATYDLVTEATNVCGQTAEILRGIKTDVETRGLPSDFQGVMATCEAAYGTRQLALHRLGIVLNGDRRPSAQVEYRDAAKEADIGVLQCAGGFLTAAGKYGLEAPVGKRAKAGS